MTANLELVALTDWGCEYIGHRLRDDDRNEVRALSGNTPPEALYRGLEWPGAISFMMLVDDIPAAAGGFGEVHEGEAMAWLLGTDLLDKHPISLCRIVKSALQGAANRWPTIHAVADARNTGHLTWLRWLGFESQACNQIGVENRPFVSLTGVFTPTPTEVSHV